MKLAVNYSIPASNLLHDGRVQFDCFKCPAWPDLVADVQEIYPTYVHFPLKVGTGSGEVLDTETHQAADWDKVEKLLAQTATPFVNVHLGPTVQDYPDMPIDTDNPAHIEMLAESMLKGLRAVVNKFGSSRVIAENLHHGGMRNLRPALLPEVIRSVVEDADCGLLLDLSHARLAARHLGLDEREYLNALPTSRIREIHITGIQRFAGRWVEKVQRAGIEPERIQWFKGKAVDHLPMTASDWTFFAWSMQQIHEGRWAQPWVVAFEYGGVGRLFKAVTETAALADQIPRLYAMVSNTPQLPCE